MEIVCTVLNYWEAILYVRVLRGWIQFYMKVGSFIVINWVKVNMKNVVFLEYWQFYKCFVHKKLKTSKFEIASSRLSFTYVCVFCDFKFHLNQLFDRNFKKWHGDLQIVIFTYFMVHEILEINLHASKMQIVFVWRYK